MELNYIAYEDLIFLDLPGYDRINTYLELKDNSWMYYILKCDISKFFSSINHDILKQKLERRIKIICYDQLCNNKL